LQDVAACADRHHDFFQSRIAGTFTEAVDGALNLPRTAGHTGQGIGNCQTQIVVAVHGEDGLIAVRHPFADLLEHVLVFVGGCVADRIGQVDCRRPAFDGGFHAAAQIVDRRAGGVHGRPFDIVDQVARAGHCVGDDLHHLFLGLIHLELQMNRGGGDEGVDPTLGSVFDSFAAAVDIGVNGAGEPGNHRVLRTSCDLTDGFEVAVGGNWKSGLDDVDTHVIENLCDLQFFFQRHGRAGRLFAVAQGGVEDADMIRFLGGSHFVSSLAWIGGSKRNWQA